MERRSAPPYGPQGSGRTLLTLFFTHWCSITQIFTGWMLLLKPSQQCHWALSDVMLAWLSVCSEVQMICILWFSGCHCHPVISCFINIQNGLPFRSRLTQVVLEKWPLNGSSNSSSLMQYVLTWFTEDIWVSAIYSVNLCVHFLLKICDQFNTCHIQKIIVL